MSTTSYSTCLKVLRIQNINILLTTASAADLKQKMKDPTSCADNSKSFVIHIFINMSYLTETSRNYAMITDYEIIDIKINYERENITMRGLTEEKMIEVKKELLGRYCKNTSTGVNILYKNFIENVNEVINKIVFIKVKIIKKNNKWVDAEVR